MSFGRTPYLPIMVFREWSRVNSKAIHTPACTGRGLIPCMAMVRWSDNLPFSVRDEANHSGFRLILKVEIATKSERSGNLVQHHERLIMEEGRHETWFRVSRNSRVANSICTLMMHEHMVQSKPKLESCRLSSICRIMMHELTVCTMPH